MSIREHQVKHNKIGRISVDLCHRCLACLNMRDTIAFRLKVENQPLGDMGFILD
jgi:hypothetical protein